MWGQFFKALIFVGFSFGIYIGCSEVSFEEGVGPVCSKLRNDYGSDACIHTSDGYQDFAYPTQILGRLDLLFVVDNSGSMSEEQRTMASHFNSFIQDLKGTDSDVSYQIGAITTDVTSGANPGGLLTFDNGKSLISNDSNNPYYTPNAGELFKNIISRPETLNCEQSGFDPNECPSGKEAAIKAVNLFLDKGYNYFFRDYSHFSVIIISDEDENSRGENLESYNLPETLVSKFSLQVSPSKAFSVNAIVVKPEDSVCLNSQNVFCNKYYKKLSNNGEMEKCSVPDIINKQCYHAPCAAYANTYAKLVNPSSEIVQGSGLLPGVMGNICSASYDQQMGAIAQALQTYRKQLPLYCVPVDSTVSVVFTPPLDHITPVRNGKIITFSEELPKGTEVNLVYKCLRSI